MRTMVWMLLGAVCGLALGIIIPVSLAFLVILRRPPAHGIGTPIAMLVLFTAPAGLLWGAYAGVCRSRTGHWRTVLAPSTSPKSAQPEALAEELRAFERLALLMPEPELRVARAKYLRALLGEYESTKPNYGLIAMCLLSAIVLPLMLVVLLRVAWDYFQWRKRLQAHISAVLAQWSAEGADRLRSD